MVAHITIKSSGIPRTTKIFLNGQDISNQVSKIEYSIGVGELGKATIYLVAGIDAELGSTHIAYVAQSVQELTWRGFFALIKKSIAKWIKLLKKIGFG